MKRWVTTAATTGIPFGLFMGLFFTVQDGGKHGLIMGAAAGVMFGLAMALFAAKQAQRFAGVREQYAPEGLVHDSAANLGSALGKAGGWLFLTKQRLVFEPHRVNVGARRVEIALGDITGTHAPRGLFASRLEVTVRSGDTYRFIVRERDLWMAMLASVARQFTATSTGG